MSFVEIEGRVQTYAWGKLGHESSVARLFEHMGKTISSSTPYAELWFGTHPSAPALIKGEERTLPEYLQSIGYTSELPYLFKVLSVNKALSIQAHPDKALAQILHQQDPVNYRDPNHKPEISIALTEFEALCGFREIHAIKDSIERTPELLNLLTRGHWEQFVENLRLSEIPRAREIFKTLFHELMSSSEDRIRFEIESLMQRIARELSEHERGERNLADSIEREYRLIERVFVDFPYDIGIFNIFLLNYVEMKPGEALFLAPNEPHAYLKGDCIECMACSDNVVRAGFTPKFKDVKTLCNMLTYNLDFPVLFAPVNVADSHSIYRPPVPEFEVHRVALGASCSYRWNHRGDAIVLVVSGSGSLLFDSNKIELAPGASVFVPASNDVQFESSSPLDVWIAAPNVDFIH
jgi:mannose-6-phosphate isomerase